MRKQGLLCLLFAVLARSQNEDLEDSILFQLKDPSTKQCISMTTEATRLSGCSDYALTTFYHDPRKSDLIHVRGSFDSREQTLCLNRALCDDDASRIQAGICSNCGSKHWIIPDAESTGRVAEEGGTYCVLENLQSDKCIGQNGFDWLLHDVGKPGPVQVTEIHNRALVIEWTPPEAEMWISSYQIQRVTNGNNKIIDTVDSSVNSYTLTGLNNGEDYTFQVRVIDDGRGYTLSDIEDTSSAKPSSAPGPPGIDTDCDSNSCTVVLTPPDTSDGSEPSSTCYIITKGLEGNEVAEQVEVPVEEPEEAVTQIIDDLPDSDVVCFSVRCENSRGVGQPSSQSCEDITPEEEEDECAPDDTSCLLCGNGDEEADFDLVFAQTTFQRRDPLTEATVDIQFRIEIQSTFTFPLTLEVVEDQGLDPTFGSTNSEIAGPINFDEQGSGLIDVDEPFGGSISVTRPAGIQFDFNFLVRVSSICTRKILQREIEINFADECPSAVLPDSDSDWLVLTAHRDEDHGYRLNVVVENPTYPDVLWVQDGETMPDLHSMTIQARRGSGTFLKIDESLIVSAEGEQVANDILVLQDDNGMSEFFWNLNALEDGEYTIRVHAGCGANSLNWPGVLDLNPPHLAAKNPSDGIYARGDDVGFVFDDTINCEGAISQMDFDGIPDELAAISSLCGAEDGRIDFNMQNVVPFALGQFISIMARDISDKYGNTASEVFTHDVLVEDLDHDAAVAQVEFDLDADQVPQDNLEEFLDDWKDTLADELDISPDRIKFVEVDSTVGEEEIDESVFPVVVEIEPPANVDPETLRSGKNSVGVAQDVVLAFYPNPKDVNDDLHLNDDPNVRVDVSEGVLNPTEDGDDESSDGGGGGSFPWWIVVLIVVVIAVGVIGFYGRKKYIENQKARDPLLYSEAVGSNEAVDMPIRQSIG